MELSEQERQRRSEMAKALHADGKFGGPQPGSGRPRKKRASEIVAERVSEEGQAIFDRLMEIVRSGTDSNSISAGRTLLDIEERESNRTEREDERIDDMNRTQLLAFVAAKLQELNESGAIPGFEDIIEGSFVEYEDGGSSDPREITSVAG